MIGPPIEKKLGYGERNSLTIQLIRWNKDRCVHTVDTVVPDGFLLLLLLLSFTSIVARMSLENSLTFITVSHVSVNRRNTDLIFIYGILQTECAITQSNNRYRGDKASNR